MRRRAEFPRSYFGQFIDHDLTFDPNSSLQKQNDPDALIDYRNPAFDLDNVYGRGPNDQPYMYDGEDCFRLGEQVTGGNDPKAQDLPRDPHGGRALIGDPRNDENAIVSQLQGLFLRFNNNLRRSDPDIGFREAQRLMRWHYQYVVLNDFLPRIVHSSVLADLKTNGRYDEGKLKFYTPRNEGFMPVEFSVGAYRLGHSMVRPGYQLNDNVLQPIFPVPSQGFTEGLTGFRPLIQSWGLDWGRFIDIDVRPTNAANRLQFAYRIDTSLVNPLGALPEEVVKAKDPPSSLAERNLLRAWRLALPSGQDVARAMCIEPMSDDEILIGKAVDGGGTFTKVTDASPVFADNCPLWTYILAEAMQNKEAVTLPVTGNVSVSSPKLGPFGGRIVAEVFLGLMYQDKHSYLSQAPCWHPPGNPDYALKDFVLAALA